MNFLNLIIFCVLLVTVTAELPIYNPTPKTPEERLDNFEHLLIQFQTKNNAEASSSKNSLIAKYDMEYFKDTSPEFKESCLKAFEGRMEHYNLDYNSDKNSLEAKSIEHFRERIWDAINELQSSIQENVGKLMIELESIRLEKDGLHFLAYYNKMDITIKSQLDLIGEEARWTFILRKFNGGKIIENYPIPKPVPTPAPTPVPTPMPVPVRKNRINKMMTKFCFNSQDNE